MSNPGAGLLCYLNLQVTARIPLPTSLRSATFPPGEGIGRMKSLFEQFDAIYKASPACLNKKKLHPKRCSFQNGYDKGPVSGQVKLELYLPPQNAFSVSDQFVNIISNGPQMSRESSLEKGIRKHSKNSGSVRGKTGHYRCYDVLVQKDQRSTTMSLRARQGVAISRYCVRIRTFYQEIPTGLRPSE